MPAVILYGPPASGKDTVTAELTRLDSTFHPFARLKVGPGRSAGYRVGTAADLRRLREVGEVIWENTRYGATYVVDRTALRTQLATDHVPVLHLGQVEAIRAVVSAMPETHWLVVYLWCPRATSAERIANRKTGDDEARMRAWDATPSYDQADLAFNTALTSPTEIARRIRDRLTESTD